MGRSRRRREVDEGLTDGQAGAEQPGLLRALSVTAILPLCETLSEEFYGGEKLSAFLGGLRSFLGGLGPFLGYLSFQSLAGFAFPCNHGIAPEPAAASGDSSVSHHLV